MFLLSGYPAMPFPAGMPLPAALVRPKRKQVKMAVSSSPHVFRIITQKLILNVIPKCTNCAAACKRCDEGRPCERCCKYGISDSCQDGVRKERKKGIKRGPYKRKGKANSDQAYEGEFSCIAMCRYPSPILIYQVTPKSRIPQQVCISTTLAFLLNARQITNETFSQKAFTRPTFTPLLSFLSVQMVSPCNLILTL